MDYVVIKMFSKKEDSHQIFLKTMKLAQSIGLKWYTGLEALEFKPQETIGYVLIDFKDNLPHYMACSTLSPSAKPAPITLKTFERRYASLIAFLQAEHQKDEEAKAAFFHDEITVYKKAWLYTAEQRFYEKVVVELKILEGISRYITDGKCRAAEAVVSKYFTLDHEEIQIEPAQTVLSFYDNSFIYPAVGKTVFPKLCFSQEQKTCASGIHFFRTFEEAVDYEG